MKQYLDRVLMILVRVLTSVSHYPGVDPGVDPGSGVATPGLPHYPGLPRGVVGQLPRGSYPKSYPGPNFNVKFFFKDFVC